MSNAASSKTLTGKLTSTESAANTKTYEKSGKTWTGKIGAYIKDDSKGKKKGAMKTTNIQIKKKATNVSKTTVSKP